MILEIINRLLMITFILSILNVIRHLFFTVLIYIKAGTEQSKYELTPRGLFLLGLSLAFIIGSLFTSIYL